MILTGARLRFIESRHLVIGPFEDWSKVRSRGRAARRRRKHPQRIRVFYKPDPQLLYQGDTVIGHPDTIHRLKLALEKQNA